MADATALGAAATAVFRALDVNEDGRVDMLEFLAFSRKVFEEEGPQEDILQRTKEIIELADRDGDERLNLHEWTKLIKAWDYPSKYEFLQECRAEALHRNSQSTSPNNTLLDFERRAVVREIFGTLDVDGTGTVDFTELTLLVDMLHLNDVTAMMRKLDLDSDQVVSAAEWEAVMLNKNIDHVQFFEQMHSYKRKLRAVRLEFLQEKARQIRAVDSTLRPHEQVRAFLKNSGCGLGFAAGEPGKDGQCVVTFSRPTPQCPVPTVRGVRAAVRYDADSGVQAECAVGIGEVGVIGDGW
jgi:Ca2+-binding EF-hand superfamily protein